MWRPRVLAPASAITAIAVVATVLVVTTNISSPGSAGAMDSSTLDKLAQQVANDQHKETAPVVNTAPGSNRPSRILLVGDSVALTLGGTSQGTGLTALAPEYGGQVINNGWVGCGIARNSDAFDGTTTYPAWRDCAHWDTVRRQQVAATNPDAAAVLVGLWEMLDRKLPNGQMVHIGEPILRQPISAMNSTC